MINIMYDEIVIKNPMIVHINGNFIYGNFFIFTSN